MIPSSTNCGYGLAAVWYVYVGSTAVCQLLLAGHCASAPAFGVCGRAVVQCGMDCSNGGKYRIAGDPDVLESGKSYLFVTRTNVQAMSPRSFPAGANRHWMSRRVRTVLRVLESDDANQLRSRFQDAGDN